jgi:glycosyltransferase involved in cell wall biosynthesis
VADRPIKNAVYVGRLVEKKGVSDIIAVAKRVADTDFTFDIYGYGPLTDRIRDEAKGAGNVRLHEGGVPNEEVKRIIKASGLFFIPCVRAKNGDMDGLPTVLMEAVAMGVPCLTTNISSIPVLVEDGVTGFVCEPGDIGCFEARIRALAGRSMKDIEPVLRAARARLDREFHPEIIHNRLLDRWLN